MSVNGTVAQHQREISLGERFSFGENWSRFLEVLDESRVAEAESSLREMLGESSLGGKRFLDVGSGSGLFSLAARRLGAEVFSFDYDPQSVACTRELKRRYFPDDPAWTVEHGSVLDPEYLAKLGSFDVVYSWGVLHHTGAMWNALANVEPLVAAGGSLFIAIYNDQGPGSRRWLAAKRIYNSLPRWLRNAFAILVFAPGELKYLLGHLIRGDLGGYFRYIREYGKARGMSWWRDKIDWIGGYPFEVAKPEEIFRFYRDRGFLLLECTTQAGGYGCNEFVFRRLPVDAVTGRVS